MKRFFASLVLLVLACAGCAALDKKTDGSIEKPKGPAFLGVSMTASPELAPISGVEAKHGVLVQLVVPDSPADMGGIEPGDVIVAVGTPDFDALADKVLEQFKDALAKYSPGDTVKIKLVRDNPVFEIYENGKKVEKPGKLAANLRKHMEEAEFGTSLSLEASKKRRVLVLKVALAEKPDLGGAKFPVPPDSEIHPELAGFSCPAEELADKLIEFYSIEDNYSDLRLRLAKLAEKHEGFRLPEVAYIHRNPFNMEKISSDIFKDIDKNAVSLISAPGFANIAFDLHGEETKEIASESLGTGLALEEHLSQLAKRLESAVALREAAFAELSGEDRKFIFDNIDSLGKIFEERTYIHTNENKDEFQKHLRLIELALKIDFSPLRSAFFLLCEIVSPDYLAALEKDLRAAGLDLSKKIVAERATSFGKIIIGGKADNWYMDNDAAIIIDLGGDDFYTNNSGSSTAEIPCAALVDLRGNDAYESTRSFAQGSGLLGVGILADLAGDDSYVGLRWCQGSCAYGVGALLDASGDDTYRAHALGQAAALWGIAILSDTGGSDRYESHSLAQGVGMCGGVAILCDSKGDDYYYAKGTYPTGYGTPGIYDGWSQGCGVGFRQYGSGGIGALVDLSGTDRYEAGNFSQGGGYYYGWGLLNDCGGDDDTYIGSRYAQGFCAHQALGTFIEEGGNDTYVSRNAVHAGLAWDECVTLFIDRAGDDYYSCENGFSQCASAHNAICIFIDVCGKDSYATGPGPGRAGPNDYHGGKSLSFFVDLGGQEDSYRKRVKNNSVRYEPEDSLMLDLPFGTLENIDEILKLAEPPKKPEEKPVEKPVPEKKK